jgi:ParB family transcriptional regulator, chromosome partitioning protein
MSRNFGRPEPPGPTHTTTRQADGQRRMISPFRCRVWAHHSRPEEQLTEESCRSLRQSIAKNNQHQPALGRPVTDDPDCEVEIICGARRHAACVALGRDLLVDVRVMTDADAYVAMYEENAERKQDCPYIQGQILRRALHSRACSSQDELAQRFGLSHSKVSRLLMVAQLPSVVIAAFPSQEDIRESWGVELYQLWKAEDPPHVITDRARALANRQPRRSARHVYEMLIAAHGTMPGKHRLNRSLPVCGAGGNALFNEKDHLGSVVFTVPKTVLSPKRLPALRHAMVLVLDDAETNLDRQETVYPPPNAATRPPS